MGIAELKVQFQQFASNKYVQGGREFLQSNSIVAKFAFLILVLIVFMLLLSLGSLIFALIFSNKHNPILIDGMIDSTQMIVIPQNPSVKNAIPIYRSDNKREGLEFTWSVWIFINDITERGDKMRHVFHKGNNNINTDGVNYPLNGPGLYIMPNETGNTTAGTKLGNTAQLKIVMNTFDAIDNNIIIKNIPLIKWVNVIIRVTKQGQLDVYINGSLVKRLKLSSVPKQNYGDIYVSANKGFAGNTSKLQYFESAIGTSKIQDIFNDGPNKKMVTMATLSTDKTDTDKYLSTRWFLSSAQDV